MISLRKASLKARELPTSAEAASFNVPYTPVSESCVSLLPLGRLGNHGEAVVIEPIEQRANCRELLIFSDRGVVKCAHQRFVALKFLYKPLVVDIEAERLSRRIKIGAVDEERRSVS